MYRNDNKNNMSKKYFQVFLYKSKLNESKLIDIYNKLSEKTLSYIMKDLGYKESTENKDILYIFSDGNCKNNGKVGSIGAYSVYFGEDKFSKFNVTKIVTDPTNNKCELSGIRKICKILIDNRELFENKKIVIVIDSLYSINCVNIWYKTWVKNNWMTAKNEPVKNKELIEQIINVTNIIPVTFKHVYSHTKEPVNKDTLEYVLYLGNKIVDDNINEFLKKNR